MNRYIVYAVAITATLGVFSCKKNNTTHVTPPPVDSPIVYPDYMALKPGNYWIYQDYRLDSITGTAHALGTFDSSYVEKDTVISGKTYHKYMDRMAMIGSVVYNTYFFRDSLSYVVNETGYIMFSSSDFTDTFAVRYSYPDLSHPDTLKVIEMMGFQNATTTVNAGTFMTSSYRQMWFLPPSLPYGPMREYDYTCAKGIGMIRKTTGFYISTPDMYERRLERYHVQ
jgi:hypothetical protein